LQCLGCPKIHARSKFHKKHRFLIENCGFFIESVQYRVIHEIAYTHGVTEYTHGNTHGVIELFLGLYGYGMAFYEPHM
jgi:hypothetical protein